MANPSLKNGYIPIARELVEQFSKVNIPGNEMRIVWVILRKTWGWQDKAGKRKNFDKIPISQFVEATEMKRANVSTSLKSLLCKSIILKTENGYGFNQNYNEWLACKRMPPACKSIQSSMQKHNNHGVKSMLSIDTLKDTYTKDRVAREKVATPPHHFSLPEVLTTDRLSHITQGCGLEHSIPPTVVRSLWVGRPERDVEEAITKACSYLISVKKPTLTYSTLLKFLNDYPIRASQNSERILEAEISRKLGIDTSFKPLPIEVQRERLEARRQKALESFNQNQNATAVTETHQLS